MIVIPTNDGREPWVKIVSSPERQSLSERSWAEFDDAGMLWLVNRILRLFGWELVREETNNSVHPARSRRRAFNEADEQAGFERVTEHLGRTIDELREDVAE